MRYYYYGNDVKTARIRQKASALSANRYHQLYFQENLFQDQDLIIEDDTVYEIDRECLRCKKNKK